MDLITERLNNLFNKKNMKGAELAELLDVNPSTVSRLLKGTQQPTADTLYKLAKLFDVTMEYLMEEAAPQTCAGASLDSYENELLKFFRGLSKEDQEELFMLAQLKYNRINSSLNSNAKKDVSPVAKSSPSDHVETA